MTYIVSFEPLPRYTATVIKKQLMTLQSYCPVNAYCWAVSTPMSAVQLRDYLMQVAPGSRIFVIRSGTEAAWVNAYGPKNTDWLKENL